MATIKVSKRQFLKLSNAYDKHSRSLMTEKSEEYSLLNDFLAIENIAADLLSSEPEKVSLGMACKHFSSLVVILNKRKPEDIPLEKLDERVRDACNLLKIMATFVHAKQKDFNLHV